MEVLCIGDPHITQKNSVRNEKFITAITDLLEERKFEFVVILGDVLHTHEKLHTVALNYALKFLKTVCGLCKTFVLVGNHDMTCNSIFLTDNHWMNCIKKWQDDITIVDRVINQTINGIQFTFSPYVFAGRFKEALATSPGWEKSRTIFAHQEFKGAKMKMIVSTEGDEWDEKDPYVCSGHIHGSHKVGKNIYYPGTPYQTNFGESKKKSVAVLKYIDEEIYPKIEKISLKMPTKETIKISTKNLNTLVLQSKEDVEFKVEITGSVEAFKTFMKSKKYKELSEKCKIVFKTDGKVNIGNVPKFIDKNDGFYKVLEGLISNEKDKELTKVYDELISENRCELEFEDSDDDSDVLILD